MFSLRLTGLAKRASSMNCGAPAPGVDRIATMFAEAIERQELLVLDGGVLGNVPPSTLVDCTTSMPRLVREGAIPREELRRRAGRMAP